MTKTPAEKRHGLAQLREPFGERHIWYLPKPTKRQTDERNNRIKCQKCGGWHHPQTVHIPYVGHAALTDRLLDVDPQWNWEPLSLTPEGLPQFDDIGGLWIKLTILGMTRLGYGSANGKQGGDAIKEIIGDALRNAAMRFGAALDLWHKGDLHGNADTNNDDEIPELPPVDVEKLKKEGIEFVKSFPSAKAAIEKISLKKLVSEEAAAIINEIFEGEDGQ